MMKRFPKSLYVIRKKEGNDEFLIASDNMNDLGLDIGDKIKIGLYKLEGLYDAEGAIEIGNLRKIKARERE